MIKIQNTDDIMDYLNKGGYFKFYLGKDPIIISDRTNVLDVLLFHYSNQCVIFWSDDKDELIFYG
jgi:hypothetical protein